MNKDIQTFLNMPGADGEATWKDWIIEVLLTLVAEGEGFSGKRPLGNSGWEDCLAADLTIINPKIALQGTGKRNEDGGIDEDFEADWERVNRAWWKVVKALMEPGSYNTEEVHYPAFLPGPEDNV